MLVRGTDLSPTLRRQVLEAYGYRWTIENQERAKDWMRRGKVEPPSTPLLTDHQWLAARTFRVVAGKLPMPVEA